ncbi:hypothetical protein BDN70DRAFT_280274 [Pholiota conissans]|uniref:Aminoglycoside phosphotransferase domain-containing protein n=1 Tax=Pholiota conissans TaxID=109636 RepID=A0A9P5Z925_9AGAR|nr:hypothetical protein BDN70DRAFT_280274 [Pholiota conissans]
MSLLQPYWDRAGKVYQLEPNPHSFHDWSQGEEVPRNQQRLLAATKDILGKTVVRTRCKGVNMNITLDATLVDGKSIILRQRNTHSDAHLEKWSLAKFQNEIKLLRFLGDNSSIPVPKVLAVGSDFTVQEKMPGTALVYVWHSLTPAEKTRFISAYVDVLLVLFRLPMPQRIGSASAYDTDPNKSSIAVVPLLSPTPGDSLSNVIDSISDYIDLLFAIKRRAIEKMKPEDMNRADITLSNLQAKASTMLQAVNSDASYLHCVLSHGDLHNYNILASNDGDITAVLDWEFNRIQPVILAIDYPLWLSTQAQFDPRFANDNEWWEESPAERARLCAVFEQTIQERDPELYKCLVNGRDLRGVVGWLTDKHSDPGFDRMGEWAASLKN